MACAGSGAAVAGEEEVWRRSVLGRSVHTSGQHSHQEHGGASSGWVAACQSGVDILTCRGIYRNIAKTYDFTVNKAHIIILFIRYCLKVLR